MNRAQEIMGRMRVKHGDGPMGIRGSVATALEFKTAPGQREVIALATSDRVDLDQEVVLPGGYTPGGYFFQNRKVFVDHQYDSEYCVASLRVAAPIPDQREPTAIRVTLAMLSGLKNPLCDDVWTIARQVGIGLSIGFRPLDYGPADSAERKKYPGVESVVRSWEWLELSFTALPCNVSCQTLQTSGDGDDAAKRARIAALAESGLIRRKSAHLFGAGLGPDRSRIFMGGRKTVVVVGS